MASEKDYSGVGEYLRDLRQHRRLSLRQVESSTGTSGSYLSQIEQGKRHPSAALLRKIAPTYGASLKELLTRAGYLAEPEISVSDKDRIEWAFTCVISDPEYQFASSLRTSELSLEVQRFIVEMYEKSTGRKLL